ncbi:tRNA (N6-isopentenyl adenosine(37)-C2)-methylthiotransferase MiaB [Amylibacter sp. SFDW26]|uniref:tRNA (N6-isopentenyl adenosine(37)-C2)-methylthiotransferase MiaB n=1 Tax=Amylibacter sp. SFDW26 TaxID=2652722 RepID=UPI00126204C5|nr:tRNA (N6-isopentenyl adenosine(37)-C2)-methylthiotransferase MiaB [Amylibacter sp. SFDW26]KAB7613350.1 tRNA (N6-isopentenyl adenosine(37)-C2)-methylthiotransferase MiaB [Amylibacter sp. SFDW26]
MSEQKKLYIKTYGCQMNVYDSERISDALAPEGYSVTADENEADLVLLNTCHIREKAAEKIYSELGRMKQLKLKKPEMQFGVAGCVAQAEGQEIINRQPMVDLVVGSQAYHNLPEMMRDVAKGQKPVDIDFPAEDKFDHILRSKGKRKLPSAFLTVQEGCDKFCAFCVVPYTRGAEVSRPAQKIIDEAKHLVDQGVVEINLLGQNVNAYHGQGADGEWSLARLIRELAKINELKRIRFTTSHPNDMDDDLIAAHGDTEKLMPYLHLPVQAGSDRVLKAMNRKHTAEEYLKLIERIRSVRKDIALSGDFIVGFPGETEADFQDTLNLCEEVRYGQAYSFKYSTRPGTPAADRDQVDEVEKADRLKRLQTLLTKHQYEFQLSMVGKILPVLLEKPARDPGQFVGKSEYLHAVHMDAKAEQVGTIVQAKVTRTERNSLGAEIVK